MILIHSAEALFYTLAFLVPGFVMYATYSVFAVRRAEVPKLSFLRFLTLSCVNYAAWSWLVYLIFSAEFFAGHAVRSAAALGWIILGSPLALGLVAGYFSQKETIRKVLMGLGLRPMHPVPTGWDYKFSTIKKAVWVPVTLKDGSHVAGLFGSKSFASSDPKERDLYIQRVYRIEKEGPWKPVERSDGILIAGDQIKYVEFKSDEKEDTDE